MDPSTTFVRDVQIVLPTTRYALSSFVNIFFRFQTYGLSLKRAGIKIEELPRLFITFDMGFPREKTNKKSQADRPLFIAFDAGFAPFFYPKMTYTSFSGWVSSGHGWIKKVGRIELVVRLILSILLADFSADLGKKSR